MSRYVLIDNHSGDGQDRDAIDAVYTHGTYTGFIAVSRAVSRAVQS